MRNKKRTEIIDFNYWIMYRKYQNIVSKVFFIVWSCLVLAERESVQILWRELRSGRFSNFCRSSMNCSQMSLVISEMEWMSPYACLFPLCWYLLLSVRRNTKRNLIALHFASIHWQNERERRIRVKFFQHKRRMTETNQFWCISINRTCFKHQQQSCLLKLTLLTRCIREEFYFK